MAENPNPEPEPKPQPFRWNAKMLPVLGLILLALALPLAMAFVGFREIRNSPGPVPELEGLRGALERAVDSNWQAPVLDGAARTAERVVPDGDACLAAGEAVQNLVRKSGGTVLAPERIESGGTRWLVRIPPGGERAFEAALAGSGFRLPGDASQGGAGFYALEIRIAP